MSTEFGINFTEKAFNILSSTIYSNKLLAPIRELSTNAWDANTDNGKSGWDFSVHIPKTAIEDFSIRDYGKGISKADMLAPDGIFTTYFKSSKEDGTKTGFMGLGSKSPFALTSVFYVTSWCENHRRTYQLDNSSGKPAIFLKDETPSEEPSGLKISFRIPAISINSFAAEAKRFYDLWEKKPKINLENFNEVNTVKVGTESYRYTQGTGELVMLMGNTPYSVKIEQLPQKYRSFFGRLGHKIIFDAPLGSLNFTASREVLESTASTVKFIENKLNAVAAEIKKECQVHNTKKFFTWLKEAPTDPLSTGLSWVFAGEYLKNTFAGSNFYSSGPYLRGYYKGNYVNRPLNFGEEVNFILYSTNEKEQKFTSAKMKYHTEQNDGLWILISEEQIKDYEKYTDQDLSKLICVDALPKRPRAKPISTKPRSPRKTYIEGVYTKPLRTGLNYPCIADYNAVNRTHRVTSYPTGTKYFIFLEEHLHNSNSLYRSNKPEFLNELFFKAGLTINHLYIIDPLLVDYKDDTEWVWFSDVIDQCMKKVGFDLIDEYSEKEHVGNILRDLSSAANNYAFSRNFSEFQTILKSVQTYNNTLKYNGFHTGSIHPLYSTYKPKMTKKCLDFQKSTQEILNCKKLYDKECDYTKSNAFYDWLAQKIINKEQIPWK